MRRAKTSIMNATNGQATLGGDEGEVGDPQLVRPAGAKLAFQKGRRPRTTRIPYPVHLMPDLARPLDLEVLVPHALNLGLQLPIATYPRRYPARITPTGVGLVVGR
jgi:hypothetical protein